MLFPRNALASWPQDCLLAEKGIIKVKRGKIPILSSGTEIRSNRIPLKKASLRHRIMIGSCPNLSQGNLLGIPSGFPRHSFIIIGREIVRQDVVFHRVRRE
jgi:hypothetical protein